MNKSRGVIILLIVGLMLVSTASAFELTEVIKDIKNSIQKLSLPGVGSITVKCDDGATCAQSGENWLITMNSMSTAQTIDLTLPSGTKSINGDIEVTTQGTVTIEVKEKAPIQTIPVIQNTNYRYILRTGAAYTMQTFTASVYERSGMSSVITTNYDVQLLAPNGNSPVRSVSYDYRQPTALFLYDSAGKMATIRPSHQISGGFLTDTASVVFVDNGYGTQEAYDKSNFRYYMDKVNNEVQYVAPWNLGTLPYTWPAFLSRMKTLGLNQYTDMPITKNGNNIILTYPIGSIGTQLQAVIPKDMALSVTVRQHWGDPVIDSVTLSPQTIVIGQGQSTLTVKVTNRGTADTINVAAIVNGAVVTNVVNSMSLGQNQQGTFTFYLNPSVSVADGERTNVNVQVITTAGGSGLRVDRTIVLNVQGKPKQDCGFFGNCPATTQKVSVTTYNPDQSTLSNAPIFKNNIQIGNGHWEGDLPFGKYTFSTNNISNPKLFAPTPAEITLAGGEPKIVPLYFSATPQEKVEDYTWIFWSVLAIIAVVILIKSGIGHAIIKSPALMIVLIVILIILWVAWQAFRAAMGFVDSANQAYDSAVGLLPWNW